MEVFKKAHIDNYMILCIAFGVTAIVLAVCMALERRQIHRHLNHLDRILETVIDGSFEERHFDESRLSSFEARFYQYLSRQAGKERELTREKKKIHGLIADISHQTKTPIANLILYADLLSEQVPEESGELSRQITVQAEKLQFLITSLIKGSRLEQGIIHPTPKKCSVGELIVRTAKEGAYLAEKKGIRLAWQIEEGTDLAWFDPKWTGEALWNLLDNVIKYTFEGDTVLIQGRAYELFYRIDVVDHGRGISEEEIPKVFHRFYRSPKSREEEGVGLGLYLAREIIQAQGGYMKVTSGKETVFSIFLLRREEAFHTELDHGAKAE